jgi:hypothetical protein
MVAGLGRSVLPAGSRVPCPIRSDDETREPPRQPPRAITGDRSSTVRGSADVAAPVRPDHAAHHPAVACRPGCQRSGRRVARRQGRALLGAAPDVAAWLSRGGGCAGRRQGAGSTEPSTRPAAAHAPSAGRAGVLRHGHWHGEPCRGHVGRSRWPRLGPGRSARRTRCHRRGRCHAGRPQAAPAGLGQGDPGRGLRRRFRGCVCQEWVPSQPCPSYSSPSASSGSRSISLLPW